MRPTMLLLGICLCVWIAHGLLCESVANAAALGKTEPVGVAILMAFYFGRDAETSLIRMRRSTALFRALFGLLIAFVVLCVLAYSLRDGTRARDESLVVTVPVLGMLCYNVANTMWAATLVRSHITWKPPLARPTWWGYVCQRSVHDLVLPMIGLAFAQVVLRSVAGFDNSNGAGLVVLGILATALAIECIRQGVKDAGYIREDEEHLVTALLRSGGFRVGLPMLIICTLSAAWFTLSCQSI